MNVRNFLIVIVSAMWSFTSVAQSNLLNAKTPDQIGLKTAAQLISDNDKPLVYGYVHDRDVLMGKTTWEIIDLSEKINFALYFPIDTANIGSDRRSLYDVLTKAMRNGKITEVYTDSYFNTKKSIEDIQGSLTRIDTTDAGREQINAGAQISPEYILKQDLTAQDVSKYKIKGYWYFDKRQSELKYRLLGICPITPDVYTMNSDEKDYIELFWVFFPAAREVLHEAKAFNDKNSAMPVSFDQILNSRRFNSVIYKEENVYGDRAIDEYMKDNAQNQLLESERVKEKIRNFEQDMWNY
ncbi:MULTISPECIES: type IX secretion system ring subunit PorN/GldN [Flavobacterium]|uniref:Gliding motility protein GldN n=1 Tax=Flavobacterium gawalongense TaxID=2594432 RepID=A0A553BJ98_9FLAO|nr:gliding motility protein GldN [Flavobacterium gawalongense]TRX04030.1 gliding motility protein GldN [Flavobacterium gawalongense]TRX07197.1 gliding motility protein GldN [Flavobacterium gawalongense]TRX08326.1 gliding motility protein GldN [Flavobacterium gawalongense]TRX09055.1 gliding motility protein GldN [Flavobacterium gawalongense]TRX25315.1 gliding motility protein GldN [Flavobacterium gawalongense]